MSIRSKEDLRGLRQAGRIVRACLEEMRRHVRPGITTSCINDAGARVMRRLGGRSAPMLVYGFPAESCISVNDEIVHGIPGGRVLREGDLVKLDVTVEKDGYMADAAISVPAGAVRPSIAALARCAERAFQRAMRVARAGNPIRAIGREVERAASRGGFSVVRDLTGHGIGRTIHEPPAVPNYDEPLASAPLTRGLVIAVEPLVAMGSGRAREASDGWTVKTLDGAMAAHYEQTIVITDAEPLILTAAA
jgi:methionyl aminopeptidase